MMLRVVMILLFAAATGAAAPLPKQPPRPTVAAVHQAIGTSHLGKEVRAIGRALGEDPVIRYERWHHEVKEHGNDDGEEIHFELKWKSKGLLLYFCRGNLHTAWMYNDKVEGYSRYVGELPEKLSFDDTIATVEKKLGKPEVTLHQPFEGGAEKNAEQMDYIYKKLGVCISFRKPSKGEAVIIAIAMFPEGDAPSW